MSSEEIEKGSMDTSLDESALLAQTVEIEGDATAITEDSGVEDPELEAIKARVKEMEEEAEKLKEMQTAVDKQMNMTSPTAAGAVASTFPTAEEKLEADRKSIYVGNVDYGATAEELEQHFHGCGSVHRVTILCDKFTGHPKGFAYVEFADKDSVTIARALNESLFRGRQIKVTPKRTNRPGISSTNRRPRGRGFGGGWSGSRGASTSPGSAPYYGGGGGGFATRGRRLFGRYRRASYYSPY